MCGFFVLKIATGCKVLCLSGATEHGARQGRPLPHIPTDEEDHLYRYGDEYYEYMGKSYVCNYILPAFKLNSHSFMTFRSLFSNSLFAMKKKFELQKITNEINGKLLMHSCCIHPHSMEWMGIHMKFLFQKIKNQKPTVSLWHGFTSSN